MKFVAKSVAASVMLGASCAAVGLHAQANGANEPVTIVSHVDIKPDAYLPQAEETAWKLFRAENVATKQDAGLVSYVLLQEIGAANHFTIVETWHDMKAYQMHTGSPHTVKFRQEIQPFLGSPFDARIHQQFR